MYTKCWAELAQQKTINGKALFNVNLNNQTYLYTISVTSNAIASFLICDSPLQVRPFLLPFAKVQAGSLHHMMQ